MSLATLEQLNPLYQRFLLLASMITKPPSLRFSSNLDQNKRPSVETYLSALTWGLVGIEPPSISSLSMHDGAT